MQGKYLTRQQAAEFLNVSVRTIDRMIRKREFGEILKVGRNIRIPQAELIKYTQSNSQIIY